MRTHIILKRDDHLKKCFTGYNHDAPHKGCFNQLAPPNGYLYSLPSWPYYAFTSAKTHGFLIASKTEFLAVSS